MQSKKGQVYLILFILVLAIAIFFIFRLTAPEEDAERASISGEIIRNIDENLGFDGVRDPISTSLSHMSFEGFGPGKSHLGKFDDWSGDLFIEDFKIIGFEGTIQTDSVNTGIGGLDTHLMSEDFFNADIYSTIKFISTNLDSGKLTGDLTFLGITKEISFPVIITGDSLSADFVLDTSQFGEMSSKANKEVRIFFELFK
jgi:hypothetical protein